MTGTQSTADAGATAARDIPVIMSRPMVCATLDGRKTMTRRLAWRERVPRDGEQWFHGNNGEPTVRVASPWQHVKVGDQLWVRESLKRLRDGSWCYAADDTIIMLDRQDPRCGSMIAWAHHKENDFAPSIHMPRWASRLTLIVTATKVEPLLDISEEDARAEGFENRILNDGFDPQDIGGGYTISSPGTFASAVGMFQLTWARLQPDWDGYSSPDVVAVSFRLIKANIDSPEVSPENAKLARARREAAFMGKDEGARHMMKSLGKVVTTFEPGSLFAALNAPTTGQSKI
jgi:hypothetical protein